MAYLIGFQPFFGLNLKVNPDVLVPRPETELMVEKALALPLPNCPMILDLCTGSGCIALALAKNLPKAKVLAVDISLKALKIAKDNARLNKIKNIHFKQSNLFSKVQGKFDLIISNPPYVSEKDMKKLPKAVKFEPKKALQAGKEGLDYIVQILTLAPARLRSPQACYMHHNSFLIFEFSYDQAKKIRALAPQAKLEKDQNGIFRYAIIKE